MSQIFLGFLETHFDPSVEKQSITFLEVFSNLQEDIVVVSFKMISRPSSWQTSSEDMALAVLEEVDVEVNGGIDHCKKMGEVGCVLDPWRPHHVLLSDFVNLFCFYDNMAWFKARSRVLFLAFNHYLLIDKLV